MRHDEMRVMRGNEDEEYEENEKNHTVLLHDAQELDDDLGAGTNEDLALAALLGVVDGIERIVKDGSLDHFDGLAEILKRRVAVRGIYSEGKNMSASRSRERKECPSVCWTQGFFSSSFIGGTVSQYHDGTCMVICPPRLSEGHFFAYK